MPDDPAEPILSPHHDYFTIWGLWRGTDPLRGGTQSDSGVIDLEQALEEGMIARAEYDRLTARCRRCLSDLGFADTTVQHTQFVLSVDDGGQRFRRAADGEYELTFCLDAQRAMAQGLLCEAAYGDLLDEQAWRLRQAGFETLDLHGDHLLLTCGLDGALRREVDG